MELNNIDQSLRTQHELFYSMLRIRMAEEKIADKYSEQKMMPVHLSIGQKLQRLGFVQRYKSQIGILRP